MFKYDYIYYFSILFRLIFLNGPSGRKKAHRGGNTQGNFVRRLGRPRWDKWGPPRAGAPSLAEPGCEIVPHCLAGKVGSPWEPIYEGAPLAF